MKAYDRLVDMTRRLYPRAPVELRVQYRTSGSFLVAYTVNLSRGGVFLETDQLLPIGTRVSLRLEVPGVESTVETTAVVVWVRRGVSDFGEPPGMGMQFDSTHEPWGEVVDELVGRFAGLSIVVVGEPSTRRANVARTVRAVLSCRVVEAEPEHATEGSLTGPFDLAVVDFEAHLAPAAARAFGSTGTPVVALVVADRRAEALRVRAAECVDATPSPSDLRGALLRVLARPAVKR